MPKASVTLAIMDASRTFSTIGVLASTYLAIKSIRFAYLFTRPSSLNRYHHGKDPWALITGASDGIGYGFAQELAAKGFNVLLHGRNSAKLEEKKSRLSEESPNVQIRILVADASEISEKQIEDIVSDLKDLHLTILVNNVGGSSIIKPLADHTFAEMDNLMNVNARFPTQLTRAILPILSKSDDPSLILNIGSLGAESGVPYSVTYSGCKALNMVISKSLDMELRAEGQKVDVLGISVGRVTEVGYYKEPSTFFTPGARTMVDIYLGIFFRPNKLMLICVLGQGCAG